MHTSSLKHINTAYIGSSIGELHFRLYCQLVSHNHSKYKQAQIQWGVYKPIADTLCEQL